MECSSTQRFETATATKDRLNVAGNKEEERKLQKSLSRASRFENATGHQAPPRHLESSVSTVSDGSAPHANKGKRKDAPKPCSQRGMSIVSGMFVALYKRCLAGKCQNPRLPGRSIMTGHLHICLLDIPSACGLLSTWQAQCQKHL